MPDTYYLDNEDRLWEEFEEDEGVQLVHWLGPGGGDVLPLTAVEEFHGPLTVLAAAVTEKRVWRTVYRRQRDLDRHPGIDPARLPLNVYSSSDVLAYQREDLAYLRSAEEPGVREAWIETRIEHPWERTDD